MSDHPGVIVDRVSFFFQAEDGIRDVAVTGVQTCALPISEESRTLRGAFCAIQKVCSINGDIDLVQAKGEQDLVHLVRAEGPDVVDGVGLIWAIKVFRSFVDRKSTRLNSSHGYISYAVFCLKKKKSEI